MFAIGIDIGGTNTRIGLVTEEGALTEVKLIPTDKAISPKEFLDKIVDECSPFLSRARGIGIGIAGQAESGILHFAPNLNWRNIPIAEMIQKPTNLPVFIENDVRAALWGEWICGAGKGYRDLLMLSLGTGLGGAIISNNQMITGDRSAAGEIGHLCIDYKGRKCTCGSYGCLEAYVGGWAIEKIAEGLSPKEVFVRGAEGDPMCSEIVQEVVEALSAGIASILNILNPHCIILGGGILTSHSEIIERVKLGVAEKALKITTENLIWKKEEIKYPGVIGSALFALKKL